MYSNLTKHRKNIAVLALLIAIVMVSLSGRLGYLMLFCSEHYSAMAEDLHQRERTIKAARGRIIDANGVVIADNRTVCTISVIYNQVKDREQVIRVLCDELDLDEELVRKRVEKRSSREIIKTNVDKELGDQIRSYRLAGVKVDEDYKRIYRGRQPGHHRPGSKIREISERNERKDTHHVRRKGCGDRECRRGQD